MKLDYAGQDTEESTLMEPFILTKTRTSPKINEETIMFHIAEVIEDKKPATTKTSFFGSIGKRIGRIITKIADLTKEAKQTIAETNKMVIEERRQSKEAKNRAKDRPATFAVENKVPETVSVEEIVVITDTNEQKAEETVPIVVIFNKLPNGALQLTDTSASEERISILIENGLAAKLEQVKNKKLAREIGFALTGLERLKAERILTAEDLRTAIKEKHETTLQIKTAQKILASIEEALCQN